MILPRRAVLAGALAAAATPALAASAYWPTAAGWATDAASFDPIRLAAAVDAALAKNSRDVLVLHAGRIAAERYADGWGPERSLEVASVGKSLVAVLIGMAIDDGHIKGLDQSAADFIPSWRATPKAAITLRHLMSMTSGLDDRGLALRNVAGDQFALNAAAPHATRPARDGPTTPPSITCCSTSWSAPSASRSRPTPSGSCSPRWAWPRPPG